MRIDLHTHSNASDGTQSPAEVVALTDHDTTAGWAEAAEAAAQEGIALVRGIEVSCNDEGISIHLLGYLQDPTAPGLLEELERAPRALQLLEQPGRRGVLEIAEQVDADAFVVAGDLD